MNLGSHNAVQDVDGVLGRQNGECPGVEFYQGWLLSELSVLKERGNEPMDFHFDVDPDLDLAIGTELSLDEAEGEFELEDFAALGIDPLSPTGAKPGSEEKVRVLAARYAAGVPLWHDSDCYDHGPVDASFADSDDADALDELEVAVDDDF